ncbi:hypothetical protein LTR66_004635 [Elasticomyces elasticus]|nr:hypothetical protein LTR66_004635 [Elasticomyces elasticus]
MFSHITGTVTGTGVNTGPPQVAATRPPGAPPVVSTPPVITSFTSLATTYTGNGICYEKCSNCTSSGNTTQPSVSNSNVEYAVLKKRAAIVTLALNTTTASTQSSSSMSSTNMPASVSASATMITTSQSTSVASLTNTPITSSSSFSTMRSPSASMSYGASMSMSSGSLGSGGTMSSPGNTSVASSMSSMYGMSMGGNSPTSGTASSASPSASALPVCPSADNTTYTDAMGTSYAIMCGMDSSGTTISTVPVSSGGFTRCFAACDGSPSCQGFTYSGQDAGNCYLKSSQGFFSPAMNGLTLVTSFRVAGTGGSISASVSGTSGLGSTGTSSSAMMTNTTAPPSLSYVTVTSVMPASTTTVTYTTNGGTVTAVSTIPASTVYMVSTATQTQFTVSVSDEPGPTVTATTEIPSICYVQGGSTTCVASPAASRTGTISMSASRTNSTPGMTSQTTFQTFAPGMMSSGGSGMAGNMTSTCHAPVVITVMVVNGQAVSTLR